ncbi:MAG: hypothetical protein ABI315_02640 [Bacteroidia bacterium]
MPHITLKNDEIISQVIIVPYYIHLRADGILYVRITPEKEETVELLKITVAKIGEMVNYKKVPLLLNHENSTMPGKAIREYWAKKESNPYSKADAFMINSDILRLVGNFYLKVNKPERPTKMFTDEQEAIKWLSVFI